MCRFSVASVLLILGVAHGANILCFFAAPSFSHQITFHPIVKQLAKNGHNLTVITPNPMRDASLTNLKEIDVGEISYAIWHKWNISSFGVDKELGSNELTPMIEAYMEIADSQLGHPRVKDIMNNSKNYQFDLFITEYPYVYTVPFKVLYNASMIGISSLPLHMIGGKLVGNFEHSSLFPDLNLPFPNKINFWQKVGSFIHSTLGMYLLSTLKPRLYGIMSNHFGKELLLNIEDASKQFDLVLVNYNPILHAPRPNVPAVIEFYGIHIQPPKELPKDIKVFLDGANEGAVYVSFGSNIKSSALPVAKRNMILQAFSELPFKVLWKFETELDDLAQNVKIMKWVPQQDVLRHPNVKLFVTQGGLQSLDEAMYAKTPVLAIPFFGDQRGNAAKVEEAGLGRQLNFFALTKDTLKAAILETAAADAYKARMAEVHAILTDQPQSAVNKTVWWIEYVLRHNGARHMRCPTVDATFIEYYMIDVIGFLLAVVLLALFFIYVGAKLMIKLAKKCLSGAKKLKMN